MIVDRIIVGEIRRQGNGPFVSLPSLDLWEIALGLLAFALVSATTIGVACWMLIVMPATYFSTAHPRDWWMDGHPLLRWSGKALKNLLGAVLVALGIVLAMPGVPGPGVLTAFLGITLLDFPGKRHLELRLVRRPEVRDRVNRLRARYGRPPLVLDDPDSTADHATRSGE